MEVCRGLVTLHLHLTAAQLWWYLLIVTNDRPVRPGGVIAATPDRNAGNVYKYHQMLSTAVDIIYIYL